MSAREHRVFSLVGPDRKGLVDRITRAVRDAGGNLEDSRMAVLGGEFAMVMLCTVPAGGVGRLEAAVRDAARELDLLLTTRPTTSRRRYHDTYPVDIRVRGMDHEGIVHHIVHHLAEEGASVESLESHVTPAPHSGTPLFSMVVRVEIPASLPLPALRRRLEEVAEPLNVDVEIHPGG